MGATSTQLTPVEAFDRHVGRYGPELAPAFMRIAGVEPGMRVLDVGCGPGALAVALGELLGEESVAAVDISTEYLEACRQRVPGADVCLAPAEELPFPDGRFDAVLAQLVVPWLNDPGAGAAEMARVARPGGVVAACIWDFEEGMPLLSAYWEAAANLDPVRAEKAGASALPPLCRPEELRELWERTGLERVGTGELEAGADYADFDDLWSPFPAGAGHSGRYCRELDEAGQAALKEEVRRLLDPPDGPFRLTARAWYVRGLAPPQ